MSLRIATLSYDVHSLTHHMGRLRGSAVRSKLDGLCSSQIPRGRMRGSSAGALSVEEEGVLGSTSLALSASSLWLGLVAKTLSPACCPSRACDWVTQKAGGSNCTRPRIGGIINVCPACHVTSTIATYPIAAATKCAVPLDRQRQMLKPLSTTKPS